MLWLVVCDAICFIFFFFQAEDGIRDLTVTGVQTCALPIFGTDDEAYRKLKERILGKRILFTDRTDLSDEQIIFGYRGQHHIERAFRDMKDPYCICFSPPRHWTDQMLRVHAFSCVLAVTLASLLHRRVAQAGAGITQSRLMEQP